MAHIVWASEIFFSQTASQVKNSHDKSYFAM